MKFAATFRVLLSEGSNPEAQVAAEVLSEQIEKLLDIDEGESLKLVEVIEAENASTMHELALVLRVARNKLLATKTRDAYDLARQLDQMAWDVAMNAAPNDVSPQYDHGKFMDIAQAVWSGHNPLD